MHRFEQFQPQVIQYFHSRHFLHNSGKNIRAHGVIVEMFAGNFYRFSQIPSDPVCTTITHIPVRSDAGSHIQQVADGHIGKICRNSIRKLVGEKRSHPICQPQAIFRNSKAYSGTNEGLGARIYGMPIFRSERFRINLRDYLSMT